MGGMGGAFPPHLSPRGSKEAAMVEFMLHKLEVNMNHSSLGCRSNDRSYVRFFFPYKETLFYV
jgi:hypothetical protein